MPPPPFKVEGRLPPLPPQVLRPAKDRSQLLVMSTG